MKKNGKAEISIQTTTQRLKQLSHLCNINNPEEVKGAIANQKWLNSTKRTVTEICTGYFKFINQTWIPPHYTRESGLPFIPTETELDQLIASGKPKTAAFLQALKETGARIGELDNLQWKDLDTERKTIYITAEKGSNSRILPISTTLIGMLNQLPRTSERVFQTKKHGVQVTFDKLKKRAAKTTNNPRLLAIHPHTFRHWKATIEYHKTKDIIHVKTILGHKDIKTTMIYINLENATFLSTNDEWTCKVAHTEQSHQTNRNRIPVRQQSRRQHRTIPKTKINPLLQAPHLNCSAALESRSHTLALLSINLLNRPRSIDFMMQMAHGKEASIERPKRLSTDIMNFPFSVLRLSPFVYTVRDRHA